MQSAVVAHSGGGTHTPLSHTIGPMHGVTGHRGGGSSQKPKLQICTPGQSRSRSHTGGGSGMHAPSMQMGAIAGHSASPTHPPGTRHDRSWQTIPGNGQSSSRPQMNGGTQTVAMQRHPTEQSVSAKQRKGWQVSPSQRSSARQSLSARQTGGGTQRKPSQRSGGGQSAGPLHREMSEQLPTRQIAPLGQSASVTQGSRGMQRCSNKPHSWSGGQSPSLEQPVATQRAASQRKPTPQSGSTTQSPVNTQRADVHVNPTEHSASLVQSPVKTHTPLAHSKPGAVHGAASEHSADMTHRPPTQSSSGSQSERVVHADSRPHRPSTQRSPGSQSSSLAHGPRKRQRPSSQRSPGAQSRSPRHRPSSTQRQSRQSVPAGQSGSDAQKHGGGPDSGTPTQESMGTPASSASTVSMDRAQPTVPTRDAARAKRTKTVLAVLVTPPAYRRRRRE
jgi:hypothetical protein